MEIPVYIIDITKSLITASLTSFLAYHLFCLQRKWEHRINIYKKIIDRLYLINKYYIHSFDFYTDTVYEYQFDEDNKADFHQWSANQKKRLKLLEKKQVIALEEMEKIISISDLIISREIINQLTNLCNELRSTPEEYEDHDTIYERRIDMLKNCFLAIKFSQKKDFENYNLKKLWLIFKKKSRLE